MSSIILECPDGSMIEILTGVKVIEPVRFEVVRRPAPTRWWQFGFGSREEYWIETKFASLGPFDTRGEAEYLRRKYCI